MMMNNYHLSEGTCHGPHSYEKLLLWNWHEGVTGKYSLSMSALHSATLTTLLLPEPR